MPSKKKGPGNRIETGRPEIYTEEYVGKLVEDLNEWAAKDDSIVLRKWIAEKGRTYWWQSELCERFPLFAVAWENARLTIGSRREEEAYRGKANTNIVSKTMHNYDQDLLKTEKELRSIEKSDENDPVVVNITNYDPKAKAETELE